MGVARQVRSWSDEGRTARLGTEGFGYIAFGMAFAEIVTVFASFGQDQILAREVARARRRHQTQRTAIAAKDRAQVLVVNLRITRHGRQHDAWPWFDLEGNRLDEILGQVRCQRVSFRDGS